MRSFWAGVATTIAVLFVALFVSLFALGVARGMPQAIDCVNYGDWQPAVDVEVASTRKHGYFHTYRALGCTAYFHDSRKDKYFH
jgi:hypothetical protein